MNLTSLPERVGRRYHLFASAVGELVNARAQDEVVEIVRRSARMLCGASGVAIVLREGDLCHYIAEDSETPLWAGQKFPMIHCISGWAMIHGEQVVIADVDDDPRVPYEAYRPTGVKSLVMTPVGREPFAAVGAYWTRRHEPTEDEIATLKAIADCMAGALRAIELREDLELKLAESERRRHELEAARREVMFQAHLLDVVEQAVIASDLGGRVVYWNAFAEKLYGWTKDEALGRTVLELKAVPDDPAAAEALLAKLQGGGSWTGEIVLSRKDGSTFPAWVSDWPVHDSEGALIGIVGVSVDNTERRRSEDHQRLLINELNHRVKNTLAIVQSIAVQSLRGAGAAEMRRPFEARLLALSDAHNLMVEAGWTSLSLLQVLTRALRPFGYEPTTDRFDLRGPAAQLAPRTAISFTLAIHELATNAVKYGALSAPTGQVSFHWRVDGDGDGARFHAEWRESGGPAVTGGGRRGFGSRLIEQGLAAETHGRVRLEFAPAGVVCHIDAPAAGVLAEASAITLFPLPS
jgi:PAS domain S-box-containing protein